ncbi:MAG: flippase-like domain-containing protein [Chloroflexi bacterium]|nr:flippase-like domain-containing protein [Chloroflexota bacterium]
MTEETLTKVRTPLSAAPAHPTLPTAEVSAAEPDPLARRFLNIRTAASFVIGLAILGFVLSRVDVNVGEITARLAQTNVSLFAAAMALYYLTFPVRALRWQQLLANVGYTNGDDGTGADNGRVFRLPSMMGLAEIVLLSWFANCIVPAKLGDAYRAYLLKSTSGVSFSKTFGTILAERIIDTLLLFSLLALSVLLAFSGALPPEILSIMQAGLVLVALVIGGLMVMRNLGGFIARLVPRRFRGHYAMFEQGTLGSFRAMPLVLTYSIVGWAIEAGRLYLVCLSLGLTSLSPAIILFVALASALLTTLPITPAGLGFVESAIVGILLLAANFGLAPGVDQNMAASVAILDRVISYWSLIVTGVVVYLLTKKR